MSVNNKLIDIEKLSRYHENLKEVLNTKEAAGEAAKAEAAAKKYADEEIAKLSFDEAGAAGEAYEAAKEYADDLVKNEDGTAKFDDKGAAAAAKAAAEATAAADATSKANAAQAAAEATAAADATSKANAAQAAAEATAAADATSKANAAQAAAEATAAADATSKANAAQSAAEQKATDLNTAMDARVVKLEAIDHDQIVADAIAAVVAGAESDFDTLKEVADWINSDTTGAAALQIKVAENADAITDLTNDKQDAISDLETIRTGAAAGAVAEQNAKNYATGLVMDGEKVRFDAAGSAAGALDDAKEYADDLVKNEDGSVKFDDKGAAAQALADAKADAAGLYQVKGDYLIPSDLTFATDGDIDGLFA